MIFYFSGTGNSARVATELAAQEGERAAAIPLTSGDRQPHTVKLRPHEGLGFVFPVHAWGPPAVMLDFLRRLTVEGEKHPYCYMICTCGDDVGHTLSIFRKAVRAKGWNVAAAFSVTMPNTYVCLPGFDTDSEELIRRKLQALPARLAVIVRAIGDRRTQCYDVHRGRFPWLKSYVLRPLFLRFLVTDKPFHADRHCTGCARCERRCPAGNIKMSEGKPVWKGQCTACLRCYHECPAHAIQFGSMTRGKGQYLFPAHETIPSGNQEYPRHDAQ